MCKESIFNGTDLCRSTQLDYVECEHPHFNLTDQPQLKCKANFTDQIEFDSVKLLCRIKDSESDHTPVDLSDGLKESCYLSYTLKSSSLKPYYISSDSDMLAIIIIIGTIIFTSILLLGVLCCLKLKNSSTTTPRAHTSPTDLLFHTAINSNLASSFLNFGANAPSHSFSAPASTHVSTGYATTSFR